MHCKAESVLLNVLIFFLFFRVAWLISIAELAISIWSGLYNLGYHDLWLLYNYMTRAAFITH